MDKIRWPSEARQITTSLRRSTGKELNKRQYWINKINN